MNKDRILALADAIEQQVLLEKRIGFSMRYFEPNALVADGRCDTACCIAGWSAIIRGAVDLREPEVSPFREREYLGLSLGEADELFAPYDVEDFGRLTSAHAAAVLRHLAETGEVDWTHRRELSPGLMFESGREDEEPDHD